MSKWKTKMMVWLGHKKNSNSSWVILIPHVKRAEEATLLEQAVANFKVYCKDLMDAGLSEDGFYLVDASEDYLVVRKK